MATANPLTLDEYRALSDFRYAIRRFLRFSEESARAEGIEPQQHQLMLAIRAGHAVGVAELAERLQLRHHSTVELIDRAVKSGLAIRHRAEHDRRHVEVNLTPEGELVLEAISLRTRDHLRVDGPALVRALESVIGANAASVVSGASQASRR